MAFSETMWLADSVESLKTLLRQPEFLKRFQEYLANDPGVGEELNFYVRVCELSEGPQENATDAASQLYREYFGAARDGVGQQQRTKNTQELWNKTKRGKVNQMRPNEVMPFLVGQADETLKSLAFDAFPRFIRSPLGRKATSGLAAASKSSMQNAASLLPETADAWWVRAVA